MYLDTAILVKLVVREPDSAFFVDLVDGQTGVFSSELAIVESRSALATKRREGHLEAKAYATAWQHLQTLWSHGGGLTLHPVSHPVLLEAAALIEKCSSHAPLRSLDAIHLATCLRFQAAPLITNDTVMRAAATALNIPLGPLPGSAATR